MKVPALAELPPLKETVTCTVPEPAGMGPVSVLVPGVRDHAAVVPPNVTELTVVSSTVTPAGRPVIASDPVAPTMALEVVRDGVTAAMIHAVGV